MAGNYEDELFRVWAEDNLVYGPIGVSDLIRWAQENRVLAGTWVYLQTANAWRPAREIEPLRGMLAAQEAAAEPVFAANDAVGPGELRPFSIFAGVTEEELERFIGFGELRVAGSGEVFLKQGDPGDALWFVLAGELRARLIVGLEDRSLARIVAGEFFGEMALLLQAPRAADIVVTTPTRVLRLSAESFQRLLREMPHLGAAVLFGIARTMAGRITEDNRRFQREVASEFVWH